MSGIDLSAYVTDGIPERAYTAKAPRAVTTLSGKWHPVGSRAEKAHSRARRRLRRMFRDEPWSLTVTFAGESLL